MDVVYSTRAKRLYVNIEQVRILRKLLLRHERTLNKSTRLTGLFKARRDQALLDINDLIRQLGEE